ERDDVAEQRKEDGDKPELPSAPLGHRVSGSASRHPQPPHRGPDAAPEPAAEGSSFAPGPAQDGQRAPEAARLPRRQGRRALPRPEEAPRNPPVGRPITFPASARAASFSVRAPRLR